MTPSEAAQAMSNNGKAEVSASDCDSEDPEDVDSVARVKVTSKLPLTGGHSTILASQQKTTRDDISDKTAHHKKPSIPPIKPPPPNAGPEDRAQGNDTSATNSRADTSELKRPFDKPRHQQMPPVHLVAEDMLPSMLGRDHGDGSDGNSPASHDGNGHEKPKHSVSDTTPRADLADAVAFDSDVEPDHKRRKIDDGSTKWSGHLAPKERKEVSKPTNRDKISEPQRQGPSSALNSDVGMNRQVRIQYAGHAHMPSAARPNWTSLEHAAPQRADSRVRLSGYGQPPNVPPSPDSRVSFQPSPVGMLQKGYQYPHHHHQQQHQNPDVLSPTRPIITPSGYQQQHDSMYAAPEWRPPSARQYTVFSSNAVSAPSQLPPVYAQVAGAEQRALQTGGGMPTTASVAVSQPYPPAPAMMAHAQPSVPQQQYQQQHRQRQLPRRAHPSTGGPPGAVVQAAAVQHPYAAASAVGTPVHVSPNRPVQSAVLPSGHYPAVPGGSGGPPGATGYVANRNSYSHEAPVAQNPQVYGQLVHYNSGYHMPMQTAASASMAMGYRALSSGSMHGVPMQPNQVMGPMLIPAGMPLPPGYVYAQPPGYTTNPHTRPGFAPGPAVVYPSQGSSQSAQYYAAPAARPRNGPSAASPVDDGGDMRTCVGCHRTKSASRSRTWRGARDSLLLCNACGIRWTRYKAQCLSCKRIVGGVERRKRQCNRCGGSDMRIEDLKQSDTGAEAEAVATA